MNILIIIAAIYGVLILTVFIISLAIKFDETHIVKYSSWHVKLFQILACRDASWLPNNVCSYFQQYALSILFIPLDIWLILYSIIMFKKRDEYYIRHDKLLPLFFLSTIMWIGLLLFYMVGYSVLHEANIMFEFNSTGLIALGVGIGIVCTIFGILALIIYLANKLNKKLLGVTLKSPFKNSLLISKFKAWKKRNCPRINYKA